MLSRTPIMHRGERSIKKREKSKKERNENDDSYAACSVKYVCAQKFTAKEKRRKKSKGKQLIRFNFSW